MKFIIESDSIDDNVDEAPMRYWSGTGWTDVKRGARVYTTEQELHGTLDRMNEDMVLAKPLYLGR